MKSIREMFYGERASARVLSLFRIVLSHAPFYVSQDKYFRADCSVFVFFLYIFCIVYGSGDYGYARNTSGIGGMQGSGKIETFVILVCGLGSFLKNITSMLFLLLVFLDSFLACDILYETWIINSINCVCVPVCSTC